MPYRLNTRDDTEADEYIVEMDFDTPEIWPIGPILGDFDTCLRSAVDDLVYDLVALSGTTPNKNHFFQSSRSLFPVKRP